MKRRELIQHLARHGCRLLREGARHSVWMNPATGHKEAIPRHSEIDRFSGTEDLPRSLRAGSVTHLCRQAVTKIPASPITLTPRRAASSRVARSSMTAR